MPKIKTKRDDVLTQEEVRAMIRMAPTGELESLIVFLYVFGCRISEAIAVLKEDVWYEGDYLYARIKTLKQKEKSTTVIKRVLKVNTNTPLLGIFIKYHLDLPHGQRLFKRSRFYYWVWIKKTNNKAWPHLFRHTRATRFAEKGADVYHLMAWFGWADPRRALVYVRRGTKFIEDLADKVD